jgi:hypothetical protein
VNNPIADIAIRSDTITHLWEKGQAIIDRDGRPLDRETAIKLIDFMWTTIDETFDYSSRNVAAIPADRSLYDHFTTELEKSGFTQREKDSCLELSKIWGAYIGAPVDKQSLKFFFLEEGLEGSALYPSHGTLERRN